MNNLSVVIREMAPSLQRIQNRVNLEERQAAVARQQAMHALGLLAGTALELHAIAEANRPVMTTCTNGGLGTVNCVSR